LEVVLFVDEEVKNEAKNPVNLSENVGGGVAAPSP